LYLLLIPFLMSFLGVHCNCTLGSTTSAPTNRNPSLPSVLWPFSFWTAEVDMAGHERFPGPITVSFPLRASLGFSESFYGTAHFVLGLRFLEPRWYFCISPRKRSFLPFSSYAGPTLFIRMTFRTGIESRSSPINTTFSSAQERSRFPTSTSPTRLRVSPNPHAGLSLCSTQASRTPRSPLPSLPNPRRALSALTWLPQMPAGDHAPTSSPLIFTNSGPLFFNRSP